MVSLEGYSYAVDGEIGDTPDTLFSFSPERDSGRVNRPHTQLQVVDHAFDHATCGVALNHQVRPDKGCPLLPGGWADRIDGLPWSAGSFLVMRDFHYLGRRMDLCPLDPRPALTMT